MEYNKDMSRSIETARGHLVPQVKRLQVLSKRTPAVFKPFLVSTTKLIEDEGASLEELEFRLKRNREVLHKFSKPKPKPRPTPRGPKKQGFFSRMWDGTRAR